MESYNPETGERVKKAVKTVKRGVLTGIGIIAVLILGLGSFYNIEEQEQAVLTTFGMAASVTEPGLHFKIPLIQRVQ